jgi:hypothetical protein
VRGSTLLNIPLQGQDCILAELRHARRGVLALHGLLLCAAGRTPTEIAAFLFCSRTGVYRIVSTYQTHRHAARCDQPLPGGGVTPTEFTLGSHLPKMLSTRCPASSSYRSRVVA